MSSGFKMSINKDEINKLIKKYKKAKKIMKSNLYQVQVMDGTETYISSLISEAQSDPPDV
jgi:putative IMPACT (imprinted ancient) family translation regulator